MPINITETLAATPRTTPSSTLVGLVGSAADAGANAVAVGSMAMVGPSQDDDYGSTGDMARALAQARENISSRILVYRTANTPTVAQMQAGLSALRTAAQNVSGEIDPGIIAPLSNTYNLTASVPNATASGVVSRANSVAESLEAVAIVASPWSTPTGGSAVSNEDAITLYGNWANANRGANLIGVAPRADYGSATYAEIVGAMAGALAAKDEAHPAGEAAPVKGTLIHGIDTLERNFSWSVTSDDLEANDVTDHGLVTPIRHGGLHWEGNRMMVASTVTAPTRFINVQREKLSIRRHIANTSYAFFEEGADTETLGDLVSTVNSDLNSRVANRRLRRGSCEATPGRNTSTELTAGQLYLDLRVLFRSPIVELNITMLIQNS